MDNVESQSQVAEQKLNRNDTITDPESYVNKIAPLGAAILIVGVALGHWLIAPSAIISLIGLSFLFLACWSKQDGFLLLGPFLQQEKQVLLRKSWFYFWRCLILIIGSSIFLGAAWVRCYYSSPKIILIAGTAMVFGVSYLLMLTVLPFGTQLLLSSIAGEREANRLDFLLITDLRNREIIFGRTLARLLPLFSHLLVTVPFFVVLSPLFGLPLNFVLLPFGYIFAMLLTTIGVAIYASSTATTTKKTNQRTAFFALPAFLFFGVIESLRYWPNVWGASVQLPYFGLVVLGDLLEYVSAANPIGIIVKIALAGTSGKDALETAEEWLPIFAAYQLLFFFGFIFYCAKNLRTISAKLAGQGAVGADSKGNREIDKPPVSDQPIYWKEKHFHELLPKTKRSRFFFSLIGYSISLLPAALIIIVGLSKNQFLIDKTKSFINGGMPLLSWIIICAGIRISAGAICRERERDTLSTLLMTPITREEIYYDKWRGSIAAQYGSILWLLIIGVPACGVGMYKIELLIGLTMVTASFITCVSSVGLLASIKAFKTDKSQQNATFRSLICVVIQGLIAAIPMSLYAFNLLPFGHYLGIILCPISALVSLAYAGSFINSTSSITILIISALASLHILAIAFFTYRHGQRKFVAMCDDGTIDQITKGK